MRLNPFVTLLMLLCLLAPAWGQATQPTTQPAQPIKFPANPKVLICSIDGLRPDLLVRAKTPTIHGLIERGAFSLWARTTEMSITLPSHVSMLTGVVPKTHGVLWNNDKDTPPGFVLMQNSVFDYAHAKGLKVALSAGKSKFDLFDKAGVLSGKYITDKSVIKDIEVANHAMQIIKSVKPDLMFLHFPGVDSSGHGQGWGNPTQIKALENIDGLLGQVLATYEEMGDGNSLYLILSADHGGSGLQHGPNDFRSRHIPWICVGPNVRKAYDLTRFRDLAINTEDTFATTCLILGLTYQQPVDGKPITQAFEQKELLTDK